MNWFLSHRQTTGQRIALSLYLELTKFGETAFLDVKAELDLHDLEKIVELCDFFVFIYSNGIFDSEFCRKGERKIFFRAYFSELEFAVKRKKPIMVIRDVMEEMPLQIPDQWKPFEKILRTPRTQRFTAYYLTEMVEIMQAVRKDPDNRQHQICYCDANYYLNCL